MSLKQLEEAGVSVEEAMLIYMNRNITVDVDTPHGITSEFIIDGNHLWDHVMWISNKLDQQNGILHQLIEINNPINMWMT